MAKWSEECRHRAWQFLSRVAFCVGVIVVSGAQPKSADGYDRIADLEEMGDPFGRIPYFLPSLNSGDELERLKVATLGD